VGLPSAGKKQKGLDADAFAEGWQHRERRDNFYRRGKCSASTLGRNCPSTSCALAILVDARSTNSSPPRRASERRFLGPLSSTRGERRPPRATSSAIRHRGEMPRVNRFELICLTFLTADRRSQRTKDRPKNEPVLMSFPPAQIAEFRRLGEQKGRFGSHDLQRIFPAITHRLAVAHSTSSSCFGLHAAKCGLCVAEFSSRRGAASS